MCCWFIELTDCRLNSVSIALKKVDWPGASKHEDGGWRTPHMHLDGVGNSLTAML